MAGIDDRLRMHQYAVSASSLNASCAPDVSELSQVQRCASLLASFKHPSDYGLSPESTSCSITQRQPASQSGKPTAVLRPEVEVSKQSAEASSRQAAMPAPLGFRGTHMLHPNHERLGRARQSSIQLPQPSLASFDSAVPVRASSSMTGQIQPRAYSASQAVSRQLTLGNDNVQPGLASIEAVRTGSGRATQAQAELSPDVSKISFRILTSGSKWNGQRGPCSPLTPIPDSPSTPSHHCRCLVQRKRHGRHKAGRFEMQVAASGDTLLALRIPQSHAYNLFVQSPGSGQQYIGQLHVASGQSRYYLLGSCGHSQSTALSPHSDPVQMVLSYSRPSPAEQQVLALIPGVAVKRNGAKTYEDLGNEHRINEVLDKLNQGYLVPGVQAFKSYGSVQRSSFQQHQSIVDNSVLLKSSKNLEMQLHSRLSDWPAVRASNTGQRHIERPGHSKTGSFGLGRGSCNMPIFACGRLGPNEFLCTFAPRIMTSLQAFGIALSSLTRSQHHGWLHPF